MDLRLVHRALLLTAPAQANQVRSLRASLQAI